MRKFAVAASVAPQSGSDRRDGNDSQHPPKRGYGKLAVILHRLWQEVSG